MKHTGANYGRKKAGGREGGREDYGTIVGRCSRVARHV